MIIISDSIFRHDMTVDVSHSNAVSIVTSHLPVPSLVAKETSHDYEDVSLLSLTLCVLQPVNAIFSIIYKVRVR